MKSNTRLLSFRCPLDLADALQEAANKNHTTMTQLLLDFIKSTENLEDKVLSVDNTDSAVAILSQDSQKLASDLIVTQLSESQFKIVQLMMDVARDENANTHIGLLSDIIDTLMEVKSLIILNSSFEKLGFRICGNSEEK